MTARKTTVHPGSGRRSRLRCREQSAHFGEVLAADPTRLVGKNEARIDVSGSDEGMDRPESLELELNGCSRLADVTADVAYVGRGTVS